jgi:hypothetical protein
MQHSVFDDMTEADTGEIIHAVAMELFDQFNQSNLDEGTMYADWKLIQLYDDPLLKNKFNEFYNLNEGDEFYFNV